MSGADVTPEEIDELNAGELSQGERVRMLVKSLRRDAARKRSEQPRKLRQPIPIAERDEP